MRSSWKGQFNLRFLSVDTALSSKILLVYSRSSVITNFYVGKRVAIYNGTKFVSLIVRSLMVGSKFGEFALTKKGGNLIHKEGRLAKKSR